MVLDAVDKKILNALKNSALHTTEISRITKISRTTVAYRLLRLLKYRQVSKNTNGRKTVWKIFFSKSKQAESIKTYYQNEIVSAYSHLLLLPKNSVILSIQGTGAVHGELTNLPEDFIKKAHKTFKRKNIILKGVSNILAKKQLESLNKEMLASHLDRSVALKLFSNNFFNSSGEIFVHEKILLLCNPSKKIVISILDIDLINIVKDLCESLFDSLEHVRGFDINKHIKEKMDAC